MSRGMSHATSARLTAIWAAAAALGTAGAEALGADAQLHDVVIRHAMIHDGSGGAPYAGELAIDGDRIAYVGPKPAGKGRLEVDARGQAVSPGFIDMMGHSEESLALKDGEPTGAHSGRILRGRAWTGAPGGGCRKSAKDWTWIDQPPH